MRTFESHKIYKCKCRIITENGSVKKGTTLNGSKWNKIINFNPKYAFDLIFKHIKEQPIKLLTN